MKKAIITSRLRLAPLRGEDEEALIALLTDREITKTYMVPDLDTEQKRRAMFARLKDISLDESRFFYGIFHEDRLIGLIHEVEVGEDGVELGYIIDPKQRGRGFATEALTAAIEELFRAGCPCVKAAAFSGNGASMRVMEKSGMTRTGQTETVTYRGEDRECICYSIKRREI